MRAPPERPRLDKAKESGGGQVMPGQEAAPLFELKTKLSKEEKKAEAARKKAEREAKKAAKKGGKKGVKTGLNLMATQNNSIGSPQTSDTGRATIRPLPHKEFCDGAPRLEARREQADV